MKIGILTFHNNYNRGSLLQTYCLFNYIYDVCENDTVEVIDYRTTNKEIGRLVNLSTNIYDMYQNALELPEKVNDYIKCEQFIRESTTLSSERKITNNHSKAIKFINDQDYDLIFVGSDEIWRVQPPSDGRFPLGADRPFPNAYFLDKQINAHTATYAASANRLQIDKLNDKTVDAIKQKLKSIDEISVRDMYTENLLSDIFNISDIKRVPDPTFIYDLPTVETQAKLAGLGVDPERPIIGIHANDCAPFHSIRDEFKEQGCQIISLTRFPGSDIDLFSKIHPFQYPNVYNEFDLVVTSSLHSTIFSTLAGTPFLTIDTDSRYQELPSKTFSLLSELDLLDRHYSAASGFDNNELRHHIDQSQMDLNIEAVNSKINTLRKNGRDYIKSVINNAS